LNPVTQVLHQRIAPASEKVAEFLDIPVGTLVVDMQRLRFINDEPIVMVTTYIPLDVYPPLATVDLTNRSLYEYLEKEGGIFITRGRRYIEAVLANETEANLLEVEPGAPLMMLDSVSYSASGQPIEYYHALHRGDRSRFEVDLVRQHDSG
jgi:GntR family transcriptional regulator